MMPHSPINHSIFRGTGSIILFSFFGWVLFKTVPIFNHVPISATGDYASLIENSMIQLTNSQTQLNNLQSIWKFSITNKDPKEVSGAVLELPFSGYYKLIKKSGEPVFSEFQNKIQIDTLDPLKETSIVVWSTSKPNPDDETKTRLIFGTGTVAVDYPMKVDGFWAWLIRSKHFISLFLLVLTLRYLI